MRPFFLAIAFTVVLVFASVRPNSSEERKSMNVKRITPVLLVKDIEPLIPFWVDRLGFAKTIEVPDGTKLGFVTFQKGTVEVMYQTYSSVEKDAPKEVSATAGKGPSYLYTEVEDLGAVLAAMKDVTSLLLRNRVPLLSTNLRIFWRRYGSREI